MDHVVPVALGGSDDPSNLVAACQDCNAGKSSSSPDAALVADVKEDALRLAELTTQAYALLVDRMGRRDDYIDEVVDAIQGMRVPPDWRNSIGRWFELGVPVEIVKAAGESANLSTRLSDDGRFKYMCGIVWNQVQTVTAEVERRLTFDGAWMTEDALTDERIAAYERGVNSGKMELFMRHVPRIVGGRLLEWHIDGRIDHPDVAPIAARLRWAT